MVDEKQFRKRQAVIHYYSKGKMNCAECGSKDRLEIDHIFNDGAQHRKELGGKSIVTWLLQNNFPGGFQVLCKSCNAKKSKKRIPNPYSPPCLPKHTKDCVSVQSITISRRYFKTRERLATIAYENDLTLSGIIWEIADQFIHLYDEGRIRRRDERILTWMEVVNN